MNSIDNPVSFIPFLSVQHRFYQLYSSVMQTGAVLTKEEQEYLSTLCRSEADSLGRIAAAVLLLLELDGSLGQAAIDQLASLGMFS
jgi:hypothetical protein